MEALGCAHVPVQGLPPGPCTDEAPEHQQWGMLKIAPARVMQEECRCACKRGVEECRLQDIAVLQEDGQGKVRQRLLKQLGQPPPCLHLQPH